MKKFNTVSLSIILGLLACGSAFAGEIKQGQAQIYCSEDKNVEKAIQQMNDQILYAKDGRIGVPILDGPAKGTNVMVGAPYDVSAPTISSANGRYMICVTVTKR